MRNESQMTRLGLLKTAVMQWKGRLGSREAVAVAIIETHVALGYDRLTGIFFELSGGDAFTRAKNAADRIFRWLDDETKDGNLMPVNFEESILAAMPEDLMLAYENARLAARHLRVRGIDDAGGDLNPVKHLVLISKETAEAQAAMANLVDGATTTELRIADRELAEAEETIRRARAEVSAELNSMRVVA